MLHVNNVYHVIFSRIQFYSLFLYTFGNMTMSIHSYTHTKMYIYIEHNYCRTMRNEIKIQDTMYGGK